MPYTYLAATRDPTLTTADIPGASCIYLFRTRSGRHGRARLYGVPFSRRACRRLRRVRMLRACPANRQPILRQQKYQDMRVAKTLLASGTDRPETCHHQKPLSTCALELCRNIADSRVALQRLGRRRLRQHTGVINLGLPTRPSVSSRGGGHGAHSKQPGKKRRKITESSEMCRTVGSMAPVAGVVGSATFPHARSIQIFFRAALCSDSWESGCRAGLLVSGLISVSSLVSGLSSLSRPERIFP